MLNNESLKPTAAQIIAFQAKLEEHMPKAGELVNELISKALSQQLLPAATTVALIVGAVNLATTLVVNQGGDADTIKKMVQDLVDKALGDVDANMVTIQGIVAGQAEQVAA
ncbi:hypothetical protein C0Q88_07925 [Ralstonia pickettii]|uniref:Uncharacterized protein n=1 Tax=Ralstonia pickettii TaxID=329 RepID=A0A2N4TY32_RALPI|nr:hypothetical protein [Ralstonia pickettii]PLC44598.1 hypothetical protein C0Q88_07925 [Ralstonia pickettii]